MNVNFVHSQHEVCSIPTPHTITTITTHEKSRASSHAIEQVETVTRALVVPVLPFTSTTRVSRCTNTQRHEGWAGRTGTGGSARAQNSAAGERRRWLCCPSQFPPLLVLINGRQLGPAWDGKTTSPTRIVAFQCLPRSSCGRKHNKLGCNTTCSPTSEPSCWPSHSSLQGKRSWPIASSVCSKHLC